MQARPIGIGERGQVLEDRVGYEVGLVPSILHDGAVRLVIRDTFLFESCQWWINHVDDGLSNDNGREVCGINENAEALLRQFVIEHFEQWRDQWDGNVQAGRGNVGVIVGVVSKGSSVVDGCHGGYEGEARHGRVWIRSCEKSCALAIVLR
jgi:hypothetical protein